MNEEFREWERATDERAWEYFAIGFAVVIIISAAWLLAVLFFGGN